jgi:hypothetical protein
MGPSPPGECIGPYVVNFAAISTYAPSPLSPHFDFGRLLRVVLLNCLVLQT